MRRITLAFRDFCLWAAMLVVIPVCGMLATHLLNWQAPGHRDRLEDKVRQATDDWALERQKLVQILIRAESTTGIPVPRDLENTEALESDPSLQRVSDQRNSPLHHTDAADKHEQALTEVVENAARTRRTLHECKMELNSSQGEEAMHLRAQALVTFRAFETLEKYASNAIEQIRRWRQRSATDTSAQSQLNLTERD